MIRCLLTSALLAVWCNGSALAAGPQTQPSPYEVTWDSPSADSNGTMPLGNGEVAVNAWIEPSGDLRFFIARTDAWDDSGRLLKVGGLRFTFGEGTTDRTKTFRQTLTVKDATLQAAYGEGEARVELRLWVDANRPLIHVEVTTASACEVTAQAEVWRTAREELPRVECSDVLNGSPEKTIVEPDTVLTALRDRIGWYHHNVKSVGPAICAKIQGISDFSRPDPLLHRTFGALVATDRPERIDDKTLRSARGTNHRFEIAVHSMHPATADVWLAETARLLDDARAVAITDRRAAHERWWAAFWDRSWIHITQNGRPRPALTTNSFPPVNSLPVSIGMNSSGSSLLKGTFGRVGIYERVLSDREIAAIAATGPQEKAAIDGALLSNVPAAPKALPELADRTFAKGFSIEAWIRSDKGFAGDGRIVDKISVGGANGFLFDTFPGNSLRLIVGDRQAGAKNVLKAGDWQHVAATVSPSGELKLFVAGKPAGPDTAPSTAMISDGDDAFVVSRAYALQRFINACAGRGHFPIKYNGSIVTVPAAGRPLHADYRAWGPGYWWQNTRLPYFSMPTSGDFDLMEPLFNMYARELMPLFKHRTRRYLDHDGAYIPECIYFWGDMFSETYGWQPCEQRADKLQASRWHKWEWVSGLELIWLLLDRYEYTEDAEFLRSTVLPAASELLVFFDQQYKTDGDGKLVMHPAQACETWWDCTNPMPELAGLHAATDRLLALPERLTTPEQRAFWRQLQAKLPALPTTTSPDGKPMLAPASVFNIKHNIECPELYAVFPFRRIAIDRPNLDWGVEALKHRRDRGPFGWRQEDLFMAYLGQADQARDYVVQRARRKHAASRFPAFWGPNYDWVPDQCHGGVLLRAVQSLLIQADGPKIYLMPAWPSDWDCEFKFHAPRQTTVSGRVVGGKMVDLKVTPENRRKDMLIIASP